MKFIWKLLIGIVLLAAMGAAAKEPVAAYLKKRNQPEFRKVTVETGTIESVVNSTGELKPVLSVSVGTFVSGPIIKLDVDFNDRVKKGQVLAEIDPRIYQASVDSSMAALMNRKADVKRVAAQLQQAERDEQRAESLKKENVDYISQTEIDQFHFGRLALEAQLDVAGCAVMQAEANLKNAEANLEYTRIIAPVDGIVIDRKIDPGQTLAAQFQTPELFVVAPDMEEKMHVFASVDEADIGLIRKAREEKRPVKFTVDAYPDDLFEGEIEQVRFSSTVEQNVVTYPVVVAAANPELKLMPGMTASLSFQVDKKEDVIRIPNAALRFFPDERFVRDEDKKLLAGLGGDSDEDNEDDNAVDDPSASEKAESSRRKKTRHVWVQDGDKLRAVQVKTGISDNRFTELVDGELKADDELVVGIKRKT